MIQVTIGGTDYTSSINIKQLRYTDILNKPNTLTFPLRHTTYTPPRGAEVIVYDSPGGQRLWAGIIQTYEREKRGIYFHHQVTAKSYEAITDRIKVAATYEGITQGEAVVDIVSKYLAADGIKATRAQPTFTRASTAYKQDGTSVASGEPRYETGQFSEAVTVEEGTTNLLTDGGLENWTTDTDLTAWTEVLTVCTLAKDMTNQHTGTACAKLTSTDVSTSNRIQQTVNVAASTQYTFSAKAKALTDRSARLYVFTTAYATIAAVAWDLTAGAAYSTQSLTFNTGANTQIIVAVYPCYTGTPGILYVDDCQLEQKAFATSWHDSTRNAETLVLPNAGVFQKGNWAKEFWFCPTSTQVVTGKTGYLWENYIDASNYYALKVNASGKPYLEVCSEGTTYTTSTASAPVMAVGSFYALAIRGDGTNMALLYQGAVVSEVPYAEPVGDLPASMYLGSDHNGANHANGLYDDDRISSRARTTAEILAGYNSGAALPADVDTTYKVSFDSSLAAQTTIDEGPTITKAVFPYIPVTQAFNELRDRSGHSWWIDNYKWLHFIARGTNVAPLTMTDGTTWWHDLRQIASLDEYRNCQIVRAGTGETTSRTDYFVGDGARRIFTCKLPLATAPTITKGGVAQTVGIGGIDTGKQFYWNKGERNVYQDDGEVVPADGQAVNVTYTGQYPLVVEVRDDAEIDARKAVEGGSGVYQDVIDDASLETVASAREKGRGYLRKYGDLPDVLTLWTFEAGFHSGQLLTVNLTDWSISGLYLITSVSFKYDGSDDVFAYEIQAASGEALGDWVDFFDKLAASGRKYVIRENEILDIIRTLGTASVICSDSLTVTSSAPESRIGTARIGYSEVA